MSWLERLLENSGEQLYPIDESIDRFDTLSGKCPYCGWKYAERDEDNLYCDHFVIMVDETFAFPYNDRCALSQEINPAFEGFDEENLACFDDVVEAGLQDDPKALKYLDRFSWTNENIKMFIKVSSDDMSDGYRRALNVRDALQTFLICCTNSSQLEHEWTGYRDYMGEASSMYAILFAAEPSKLVDHLVLELRSSTEEATNFFNSVRENSR